MKAKFSITHVSASACTVSMPDNSLVTYSGSRAAALRAAAEDWQCHPDFARQRTAYDRQQRERIADKFHAPLPGGSVDMTPALPGVDPRDLADPLFAAAH